MSSDSTVAETGNAPAAGKGNAKTRRGYLPDRRVWYLALFCGAALLVTKFLLSDDSAFHIVAAVSSLITSIALLTWFACFSAYPSGVRWSVTLLCIVAVALLVSQYRVLRFSGNLMPTIIRRGAPDPDQALPQIQAETVVDLATTTPDDFPQFLGPQRQAVVGHIRLSRDWDQHPPRELWRRDIGAGWSGFVAVNGFAVTMEQRGTEELVTCYDIETGEPQWSSAIEAYHDSVFGFKGPRSTPTIHEGRVYAMGATGVLRSLDGSNGTTIWSRDFFADLGATQAEAEAPVAWGRSASPLIVEQTVVVPVGGTTEGSSITLAALNLSTGETIWESDGYQISYASPALITLDTVKQIVSVNENFATGHDPKTGALLWAHPWPGISNMDANCSQPVGVDGKYVLLTKGYGGGGELIEVTLDGDHWGMRSVWKSKKTLRTKFSNLSIRDGFAYGLDDGVLTCAEVASGERQWRKGRFGYGQNLLVGDVLLVLAEFGELAMVDANPVAYQELARIEALEGQTWNNLCLYGNRLLLRNSEAAVCYELTLAPDSKSQAAASDQALRQSLNTTTDPGHELANWVPAR